MKHIFVFSGTTLCHDSCCFTFCDILTRLVRVSKHAIEVDLRWLFVHLWSARWDCWCWLWNCYQALSVKGIGCKIELIPVCTGSYAFCFHWLKCCIYYEHL